MGKIQTTTQEFAIHHDTTGRGRQYKNNNDRNAGTVPEPTTPYGAVESLLNKYMLEQDHPAIGCMS